jgi:hypothetical protein
MGGHRVVATNDAVGPVYQCEVFLDVERNAGLGFVDEALLDVNCKVCVPSEAALSNALKWFNLHWK